MAVTKEGIAQKALQMIGANTIASFDDGTTEANFMNVMYEEVVSNALSEHPWSFASALTDITSNRLLAEPEALWDAKYQIPVNLSLTSVHAVYISDSPQKFDRFEDDIYINASDSDTVILRYGFRPSEANWPDYFRLYVIAKLALFAAISITRNDVVISAMGELDSRLGQDARLRDSQSRTAKKARLNRFQSRRR